MYIIARTLSDFRSLSKKFNLNKFFFKNSKNIFFVSKSNFQNKIIIQQ